MRLQAAYIDLPTERKFRDGCVRDRLAASVKLCSLSALTFIPVYAPYVLRNQT